MTGAHYFVTFRPRCWRNWTAEDTDPPFCDGSIRREPDFEHECPSITALCRGRMFAPRLQSGDRVIYATVKGRYLGGASGWHLVAALEVVHRLESHDAAAAWYQRRALRLPSNCMVRGNRPLRLDRTHRGRTRVLRSWDAGYWARSRAHGVFLVCRPLRMDLVEPPFLDRAALNGAFDLSAAARVPSTQSGLRIERSTFERLIAYLPRRVRRSGQRRSPLPIQPARPSPNSGCTRRSRPVC